MSLNILKRKIESLKNQLIDVLNNPYNQFVDNEGLHLEEDDIMYYFIKVTASNKYDKAELVDIAKKIKEINKLMDNIGRWYS